MLGKTVLLYTGDKHARRRLSGHLRAAGNEVVSADDAIAACDLIGLRAVDLVLVDGGASEPRTVVAAARNRAPVVVLSAGAEPAAMLDFVCELEVEHFLAGDDSGGLAELARDVVVTAEKILRGELFGVDKYLPGFGVEMTATEVRGAADRDGVVECIADQVEWLGGGREARRAVAAVVDELITNAVYDAPCDLGGQPRYAGIDRRHKVELDPWEYVTVQWGSDGDVIAISVTDWFGRLRPEHVRSGLRRCLGPGDPIEYKPGGAGLGLYAALSVSTQLVINVERGVRTEVIAVVDLRRRGHGARPAGRSLHLFVDEPRVEVTTSVPTTVEVSDTMRTELLDRLAPLKPRAEVVPLTRVRRRAPVVARGTTPPASEPVEAGTACGLLHGAGDPDAAVTAALRFLALHYQVAVGYQVDDNRLEARLANGRVTDWHHLRKLRLISDGPASIARLALAGQPAPFSPASPIDHHVAMSATGDAEATGLVVPVGVDGELRWVLYAAAPLPDVIITPDTLEQVAADLEACLRRLDPEEPEIEISYA